MKASRAFQDLTQIKVRRPVKRGKDASRKPKRERVFERDGHRCLRCGASEALTIDHVEPLSKGGPRRALSNLMTLCFRCNGLKADMSIDDFIALHGPFVVDPMLRRYVGGRMVA